MSVELASPIWLALLLGLPLWWRWVRPAPTDGLVFARGHVGRDAHGPGRLAAIEALPTALRVLALASLIVALCHPSLVRTVEEPATEGVGIAFAIDLSTSMWADDMARGTTRLDAAKSTVLSFLENRSDDVGLVAFAGEALTRLPLTNDGFVVEAAVEALDIGLLVDGTDIAGAIAAGAGLLEDAPHGSKVLILVTDGAHNKAGLVPALAARAAAAVGVTVYPIAIGEEEEPGSSSMETVLTQAARITGGRYFRATDVEALEAIYAEIDRLTLPSERMVERTESTPLEWLLLLTTLGLAVTATAVRGSRWGVVP